MAVLRLLRRHRRKLALAGLLGLVAVGVAVAWLWHRPALDGPGPHGGLAGGYWEIPLREWAQTVRAGAEDHRMRRLEEAGVDAVPLLIALLALDDPVITEYATRYLAGLGPAARDAVPALTRQLRGSPFARLRAADALGAIGAAAAAAAPAIEPMLDSPSFIDRAAAARTAGNIGAGAVSLAPSLVRAARDADGRVRVAAIETLGRLGSAKEPVLATLGVALGYRDTRAAAADAAARLGPGAAGLASSLAAGLATEPRAWVRRRLAVALAAVGPAALPALIALLDDEDAQRRMHAIEALAALGPEGASAVPGLLPALRDEHTAMRRTAARTLGRIGPSRRLDAIAALTTLLEDGDPYVRVDAWRSLIALGAGHDLVGQFVAALEATDTPTTLREGALDGLAALGPGAGRAVPAVTGALADPALRARVPMVLAALAGEPHGLLVAAASRQEPAVREGAVAIMGAMRAPSESMLTTLVRALADAEPAVRKRAAEVLRHRELDAGPALAAAADALRSPFADARQVAAHLLARSAPRAPELALTALSAAMGDSEEPVRLAAVEGLSKLPGHALEAGLALQRGLSDPTARVRAESVRALGKLGPDAASAAVGALLRVLEDPDAEAREAAVRALAAVEPLPAGTAERLAPRLEDARPEVRVAAASTLCALNDAARPAVPWMLAALRRNEGEPALRRHLSGCLEELVAAVPESSAQFRRLLEDPDPTIRFHAARTLWRAFGDIRPPLLDVFVQSLAHDDAQTRAQAATLLGEVGEPAVHAFPALLLATLDSSGAVQIEANGALVELNSNVAPLLSAALRDPGTHAAATAAVVRIAAPVTATLAPLLGQIIADPEQPDAVREAAAESAARLEAGAAAAVPGLVLMLGESATAGAATSTVESSSRQLLESFQQLLGGKPPSDRYTAAVRALAAIGPAAGVAVPTLWRIVADEAGAHLLSTRVAAIRALGQVGAEPASSVPGLLEILTEPLPRERLGYRLRRMLAERSLLAVPPTEGAYELRVAAGAALATFPEQVRPATETLLRFADRTRDPYAGRLLSVVPGSSHWRARLGPVVGAIQILGALREQRARSLLVATIERAGSGELEAAAAGALLRLGAIDVEIELIRTRLTEARLDELVAYARAIGAVGEAGAPFASLLVRTVATMKAFRPTDEQPIADTITSVGNIGSAAAPAVPNLIAALDAEQASRRAAAALALRDIGAVAGAAAPRLSELLADPNATILTRGLAAAALGRIGADREPARAALMRAAQNRRFEYPFPVRHAARQALGMTR